MTEFFIDPAYKNGFERLGLTSIGAIFSFQAGKNLAKDNLAAHRSRIEFQIESPATTLFLKRYYRPPVLTQFKNWLSAKKRISCGFVEFDAAKNLTAVGINVPKMVAWGQQWGMFFEERSFVVIGKVPTGESLERKLPDCFNGQASPENLKMRRRFIEQLAAFVKKFHDTGCCHRDLYLCHIFLTAAGVFYLIDLARVFRPLCRTMYQVKDLAQLHYSAPARRFSKTDRLRFLRAYLGRDKLNEDDKIFIRRISGKARRMARHDAKHGRTVPFET